MAGHMDEDDDDDDSYADEVVDDWLPEDDPEPDLPKPPAKDVKPKIDIVRKSEYIVNNLDLYYALCEVDDWEFSQKEDWEQEIIMKTIMIEVYNPGENVILEGDGGNEFYIVIATEKTAHIAEIEVVNGNLLAGTEVFLTRLHRGQYFGQKYFITRRSVKRGATCRVPFDSLCSVHVAKVSADHFDKKQWCDFRNILLGRTVPLIQGLPRKERIQILQSLTIKEFKDKEFIIRQGEKGEECYIIQEGAVKVVESRGDPPQDHFLVTLREGHLFGEMSLVTDEPRVASVISVKTTICLCLTKQVFRGALSDKTFDDFLNEQLRKRQEIRKNREIANAEDVPPSSPAAVPMLGSVPSMRRMSYRKNKSFNLGEVKEVGTLNVRKLESGTKIINKYRIDRALGKGAFGEVYLCVDEETGAEYAMKQINRPQNRWNEDESNSIKLEIAVMKRMKHNNIVELHEVIDDQNARKIYLIQEYMEGGALMPDAETCTPISVTLARQYFRDIVRGVCYLHSEGIIHRDIKPQNMLLSKEGVVKIADFGAAAFTEMSAEKTAYGGTPAFMAPELFLTNTHIDFTKVEGIDVFALGATLYYLVVGRPPWMANNQIDLATKIKNIELTFPNDIIDPHLKHLLRQMLAKDYRTRCDLDSVVEDDWVTFEGSEPLFEEDDSFGSSWNDFSGGTAEDGRPVLKALLIDNSISKRKMLLQQLNSVRHVMCACVNNGDDAVEIIKVAVGNCPINNFDVVFCELVSEDVPGCNTVRLIQESGFKGRIVGLVKHNDDLNAFLHHGAHVILRRPIAHREIVKLFAELDLFNESLASNAFKALSISAASADQAVSKEEVEAAITFSLSRAESSNFLKNAIDARTNSSDEDDVEPKMEDFQNFRSIKSKRGSHEFELDDEQEQEESPDNTRLSFAENKSLSRKRGFMVVPYGGVAATSSGSDIEGGDRLVFDKPLKIFSINKAEDKRRERREAAMNKSKLAHQYREAKRTGGDIHSSKSLLTILKKQSSKRNLDRKNTRSFRDDISGLGSQRSIFTPGSGSTQQSRFSQYNTNNVSLRNIDTFIGNTVADCGSLDEEDEDNTEDVDFGLDDALLLDDDSDSDDNNNDSVVDDDDDDDDDDLADFGVGGDDIFQIDSSNAFDDLFAELIVKKPVDETIDIQVWNHIMVGSVMRSTLSCNDDQFDAMLGIRCGKSENIVGRSYMEDRSYANPTEPRNGQRCPLGLFSVFDGHNGDYVAVNLQNKYAPTYREFLEAYEERTDFTKPLDVTYESRIAQVFEDTCSLLDLEILEKDFVRQQKNLKSGIQDIQSFAGSVGVSLAIMPALKRVGQKYSFSSRSGSTDHTDQSTTIQVFVSHVGDCRAVLCNDGVAVQLTEDHKANNKMEKLRIEAAGGWVHNGRVNGALGVSRSFGDIQFKNFDGTAKSAYGEDGQSGIWGRNQQVVSKPEFKHFVVENTYEFVVMASDGLWDVFSCQEAVNFVRQQLSSTNDLNKAADALIQKAIARGTQDNTSVVIIAFHQR